MPLWRAPPDEKNLDRRNRLSLKHRHACAHPTGGDCSLTSLSHLSSVPSEHVLRHKTRRRSNSYFRTLSNYAA